MAKIYKIHPETPQARVLEQVVQELRQGAVMLYPTDTVYAIGCDMVSKDAIQRVRQMKRMSNDKPLTFLCPSLSNIANYAVVTDSAYRTMKSLIPGPYTFILPATKLVPKLVLNPKRKTTGIRVPDHQICQALLTSLGNPIISSSAPYLSANPGQNQPSAADDLDLEPNEYYPKPTSGKGKSKSAKNAYKSTSSADQDNYGNDDPSNQESKFVSPGHRSASSNIYELSQVELFDYFDKLVDIIIDDGSQNRAGVSTILDMTGPTPELIRQGAGDVSFLF
ncbi:MAG: L-threonylcarbamoyladenylate synthase [Pseudanabaenaceae cyanobacterium]